MKRDLLIIVLVSSYFFIFGNWLLSITSPDEGKNLDAALRMLETNDFIVPKYNCELRFEKPPMFYWLTDMSFLLFGVNEFAGRLVSGVSALLLAILTYLMAGEFSYPETALLSALVFATFPHNWVESRGATPEMLLTFFMTLGLYLFVKGRFTLGWIALSLAFLTKGPVGVILPFGVYLLWKRNLKFLNLKGILLFVAIGFSWYGAMLYRFGSEYFYKFFLYENVMRFTGHKSIHPYPFWYYLPIVAVNSVLYLPRVPNIFKNWNRRLNPFLLWFLLVLLFYSASKNKLHHYILFLYPPLAVIFATFVGRRYIKAVLLLSALILLGAALYTRSLEEGRFVPKAVKVIGKINPENLYFYKIEETAVVFYTRRCIEKLENPKAVKKGDLVITREEYLEEFEGASVLVVGKEFGKKLLLIELK